MGFSLVDGPIIWVTVVAALALVAASIRPFTWHRVRFVADWQQAAEYTASIARPGDYVITLGCGDVYRIIPQVLDALGQD